MVKPGHGLRFTAEAFDKCVIGRQDGEHDLQCDVAPQPLILYQVDIRHPAPADVVDDLKVADCGTD
jgi:hypothetical protein